MKKVLLVEDNSANRLLFSRLIAAQGYVCLGASDGLRGLHMLEDNPDIVCVMSDCQMPNLDGPGLAYEIRRRKGQDFPVLLYSSFLSVKDLGEMLDKGASAVLNYPLTAASLREYLGRYLHPVTA